MIKKTIQTFFMSIGVAMTSFLLYGAIAKPEMITAYEIIITALFSVEVVWHYLGVIERSDWSWFEEKKNAGKATNF